MKALAFGLVVVALVGCGGSSGQGEFGGDIGGRGFNTSGGGATTTTGGLQGTASVSNEGGFGFVPQDARFHDLDLGPQVDRAVVSINAASGACDSDAFEHVELVFGSAGVPLVAGSYLVDGGASIAWSTPTTRRRVVALSGLINCNSVTEGAVAGSFSADLPLGDGGLSQITGIFTAVPCSP